MTDNSKIYLVFANWMHECSNVIMAFLDEKRAQAFCDKCNQYQQTKEAFPAEANDNDAVFEAYIKRGQKWLAAHPAGDVDGDADNFTVGYVPFDSSPINVRGHQRGHGVG